MHEDLKPESVMIVNHLQQPLRVKVIDFGLACEVSEAQRASHIQTRWCTLVSGSMAELNFNRRLQQNIFAYLYVQDQKVDPVIKHFQ